MKFFNSVFYAATGLGVVGLLGCGSESVNYDGGEDSASSSQQAEYTPPEGGYLKEPFFTMGAQDSVIGWSFTQHSSDISYSVTAEDGVLSITRTGDEPWAKVRQFFKDDVDQVLGKKLKFSADVKADFTSEWGEAMEPPSLTVLVKGIRAGEPAILGKAYFCRRSSQLIIFWMCHIGIDIRWSLKCSHYLMQKL